MSAPRRAVDPAAERRIARADARLAAWLARWAPEALRALRGPAREDDLRALEAQLARPLPDELAVWLARHDGAREPAALGRWVLAPVEAIASTWSMLQGLFADDPSHDADVAPAPGVAKRWWSSGWVPFAADGAGNHLCVDLDPAPGGAVGQVLEHVHDHVVRPLVAGSFGAWLEARVDALEGGALVAAQHADGAFAGLCEPSDLVGSAALYHIRDESPEARRVRLERTLYGARGGVTAIVVPILLAHRRVALVSDVGRHDLWRAVEAVVGGARGRGEVRAAAILDVVRGSPAVARCDLDEAALGALLDAALGAGAEV